MVGALDANILNFREKMSVTIENYKPVHKNIFRKLNENWITTYFKLEQPDIDALFDPQGYILDKGGFILVASIKGEPVGVCALLVKDDLVYPYELAKMAVAQSVRGKKVGWLLGQAIIEKAKSIGAQKLFLESNTILEPAINLYRKLGFKEIQGSQSPYDRSNIQMELDINNGDQGL